MSIIANWTAIQSLGITITGITNYTQCPQKSDIILHAPTAIITGTYATNQLVQLADITATIPPTPSRTPSISVTPSRTPSASVLPSVTPSRTPSASVPPSVTPSISVTPSRTPSASVPPSVTPSISVTPSPSPSNTALWYYYHASQYPCGGCASPPVATGVIVQSANAATSTYYAGSDGNIYRITSSAGIGPYTTDPELVGTGAGTCGAIICF